LFSSFSRTRLLRARPNDLVAGLFEVLLLDEVLVLHRGGDRRLVDDRRQIGAAEHRRAAGDPLEVHVRARA
jgi:hypothetical protein